MLIIINNTHIVINKIKNDNENGNQTEKIKITLRKKERDCLIDLSCLFMP